ncbi:GIY-YIG nuclease family protein [Vibrio diazotrophicus]|uniref:GIY-YIG nuclease family protein n=1 Tax=Vibrio diazotrophicus TaxID=685 RepID=UPI00142E836B|nr:GIY-YIG nuclease family protein [Vibrio diazotrophicus]
MNFDFDDEAASPNSHYAMYPPLEYAWLYIAIDIRDMDICKVGLTTRESPHQRVSQGKTYNPFLFLFASYELSKCTYGVSQKELDDIERYIHRRSIFGGAIKHLATGRDSEWFSIHPEEAERQIDWILAKRGFAVDGKVLWSNSQKDEKFNFIAVERMKKIKTVYRPEPWEMSEMFDRMEAPYTTLNQFYRFLREYHDRDADGKIFL